MSGLEFQTARILPEAIRIGRRALDGLDGYRRLRDLFWDNQSRRWIIQVELDAKIPNSTLIPNPSRWFVAIDDEYPWGDIKFYPASEGGIATTFPHQAFNSEAQDGRAWRNGALCLDTTVATFSRKDADQEPFSPEYRLWWHMCRAIAWLKAAHQGALLEKGDPFELPAFPTALDEKKCLIFSESEKSFPEWKDSDSSGFADVTRTKFQRNETRIFDPRFVTAFYSREGKTIHKPSWGSAISRSIRNGLSQPAIWLKLPAIPVLEAWRVPMTWKELSELFAVHGIDITQEVLDLAEPIRTSSEVLILLGFAIPKTIAANLSQMHWQAFQAPLLKPVDWVPNGFRRNAIGFEQRQRIERNALDSSLTKWISCENWSYPEVSTRGQIKEDLREKHSLVVGAGAIGSILSDQLTRSGTQRLTLIDSQPLAVGNLTRHVLGIGEIGFNKAPALAIHLQYTAPHATVDAIDSYFPPASAESLEKVNQCEVIFDATGSDAVIHRLSKFNWSTERLFVSFSIGMGGNRLFAFFGRGTSFPEGAFRDSLRPWLKYEKDIMGTDHPREGTGCWHPVFPARLDDIQSLVSMGLKCLEEYVAAKRADSYFTTFEFMKDKKGSFCGIGRVDEPTS